MKILSNKKYRELVLKSCRGMFGAVTDDMLLRSNAALSKELDELKERINKTIEYIENQKLDDPTEWMYAIVGEDVLKLLRGEK